MIFIIDLDGTIVDHSHRGYVPGEHVPDEKILDDGLTPIGHLVRKLSETNYIIVLTAREYKYGDITQQWLRHEVGVEFQQFFCKEEGNTEKDWEFKERILLTEILPFIERYNKKLNELILVEDNKEVCKVFKSHGVNVLNVF